jgi:thiol-disulfide isomerase/thioredoxin
VLSRWQEEHAGALSFATVSADSAAYDAYQVTGTPSGVLISADGQIASYLAEGAEAMEQLLEGALRGDGDTQGLRIGTPAPSLDLRDLDERAVALADPAGRDTLILFWNPGCGYCNAMRSDLLAWEGNTGPDAPRLLVVSSGDPEQSRADGFRSVVALDTDYAVGEAFGAAGTPMAVLIDGDGRIASGLVTGAAAVLTLAGTRRGAHGESPIKVIR